MKYPTVTLKSDRLSDHPWVFRMHLQERDKGVANGSVADLVDRDGRFLARGLFNGHARIGFRTLTSDAGQMIDADFFRQRIGQSIRWRMEYLQLQRTGNVFRLINSEGDGLSGLVVDKYGDIVVLEFYSSGMFRLRDEIIQVLSEHFPSAKFFWFAESHVQKQESFDCTFRGEVPSGEIVEHGVRYLVDCSLKHKTGFYADQRDNRLLLSELCRGKSVLDLCSFSGGFALAAKVLGGASNVTGVELDPDAVAIAQRNASLNQVDVNFVQANFLDFVEKAAANDTYDIVIFDPPKQTKNREELDTALRRYAAFNRAALKMVKPGGIFVSCSCSGLVDEQSFLKSLRRAAFDAKRGMQVFRLSGAGADHPFAVSAPEGRYLKVAWSKIL